MILIYKFIICILINLLNTILQGRRHLHQAFLHNNQNDKEKALVLDVTLVSAII